MKLPVDNILPRLVEVLRTGTSAVLVAPTGAGKTTRVPPALLEAGLAARGRIVMLEPRRVAARAAARRIAEELGTQLGDLVGYQVRFDRRSSRETRILVVTEGILVRMLQDDPFLEGIGVLVFDEFHERSLDTDLTLALARRVQLEARSELRLVVMSATIDAAAVAAYLDNAPILESRGRIFPVAIEYHEASDSRPTPVVAAAGVRRAAGQTDGGILCFLPGVREIRRTQDELQAWAAAQGITVFPLYGDLPPESQDLALRRGQDRRIILATNVAETSVTVEGVTAVVDTGLERVPRYDVGCGLDRLELGRISRASADQRTGRAGREAPGFCLRLWTAAEHRGLRERQEPEIRRVDVAGAALQLLAWGESDLRLFPWLEPPEPAQLERAQQLLEDLGATRGGRLTEEGRTMARLPVHPRQARLLVEGHRFGQVDAAAGIAAILSERDTTDVEALARRGNRSRSDLLDRLDLLESQGSRARSTVQAIRQLSESARRELGAESRSPGVGREEAVLRSLLAAYLDRVARRRAPGSRRGRMVGGRGVTLAEHSGVLDAEFFLCVDIDAGARGERAEALVRMASEARLEWLPPDTTRSFEEVVFDSQLHRVVASRKVAYRDLVLSEVEIPVVPDETSARLLAEAAAANLDAALRLDEPAVDRWLRRLRSLRNWMPELDLPSFDRDELVNLLPELCVGKRSFQDLKSAPLLDTLRSRLTHRQSRALEQEAPERLEVPSGSRVALAYEPGQPPVLAARIQELFGLHDSPRLAGGRVPVLLHLLAPNGRPQQVTQDLRSFWDTTYQEVRREMRGRYPKHAWPEDPWNAPAERRPGRKRSG